MLISIAASALSGLAAHPGLGLFMPALLPLPGLLCCCFPFGLLFMAFWVWMLVDCLQYEASGDDKIIWVLVIVLLYWLGAVLYFALRYKKNRFPGTPGTGPGPGAAQPPPSA